MKMLQAITRNRFMELMPPLLQVESEYEKTCASPVEASTINDLSLVVRAKPCVSSKVALVREPLTAGVGTASYAAPEQVASQRYGAEADVFSMGLILLELLCSFGTEHERFHTFADCRHKRKLPGKLEEAYPDLASHCSWLHASTAVKPTDSAHAPSPCIKVAAQSLLRRLQAAKCRRWYTHAQGPTTHCQTSNFREQWLWGRHQVASNGLCGYWWNCRSTAV